MMAVALSAMVTMAATDLKRGDFDIVTARHINVENDDGKTIISLGLQGGNGGAITTYSPTGTKLVWLTANPGGGGVLIFNTTGEDVVQLHTDEYGNGVVGAFNRKGTGRTLKPGP